MSTPELTTLPSAAQAAAPTIRRDAGWLRAARQAKWLAWASLVWMGLEGGLGIFAGVQAHSLGVLTWAGAAAVPVLEAAVVGERSLEREHVPTDTGTAAC